MLRPLTAIAVALLRLSSSSPGALGRFPGGINRNPITSLARRHVFVRIEQRVTQPPKCDV